MGDLVNKEYLRKQFSGYSTVVKEQLDKKVDIDQGVDNKGKLLGIDDTGKVTPVETPSSVDISSEQGNMIEEKTDGIYVKDMSVKISSAENNALTSKEDGLYVPSVSETKISQAENNIIETKEDGIYVAPTNLDDYSTTDEVKELIKDELYTENVIPAHYEISDASNPDALEVVADGTATDGQIEQSSVADIGANVGDYVVLVPESTTTESKYALKDNTYSKDETDAKILEAVTDGTVSLDGYVKEDVLNTTLEDYIKETDADEKYVLDEEIIVLSESDITALLGLSETELEGIAQILLDTSIQTNKTWSSSKIYSELNTTLDSAKQYTLDELSKAVGASYKVVHELNEMVSDKVLYLMQDTSTGIYDIYIHNIEDDTSELIGTFEVNLDNFYTKTESEDLFATKADVTANYATKQEVIDGYAEKTAVDKILDGITVVPKATDAETLNGLTIKELSQSNARNLIPYPYVGTTEDRGVAFTDNGNGTISAVGQCTTTSAPYYNLVKNMYLNAGTYTLSPCTDDTNAYIGIFFYDKTNNTQVYSSTSTGTRSESGSVFAFNTTSLGMDAGERTDSVTFTIDDDAYVVIQIRTIADNSVAVNLTFKPMLEIGAIAHDYVQYVGNATVKVSTDENNQIQQLEDGLFVDRPYIRILQADYENLSYEEKHNNIPYYIEDAEPTQDGSVNTDADTLDGYHADGLPYLPTTGGTQYKNVSIYNHISTDLRDVLYGIDHNGALIVKDDTNGKYLIVSSVDGATTYYGNLEGTASGNLPISGGKLTGEVFLGSGNGRLNANTLASSLSSINEEGGYTTNSRTLSINNSNSRTIDKCLYIRDIIDGVSTDYTVLHSGNVANYACTTTVADVARTTLSVDNITNYVSGEIAFTVRNGICFVELISLEITGIGTNISTITGLPTPSIFANTFIGNSGEPIGNIFSTEGATEFTINKKSDGVLWGSFSYPVKES